MFQLDITNLTAIKEISQASKYNTIINSFNGYVSPHFSLFVAILNSLVMSAVIMFIVLILIMPTVLSPNSLKVIWLSYEDDTKNTVHGGHKENYNDLKKLIYFVSYVSLVIILTSISYVHNPHKLIETCNEAKIYMQKNKNDVLVKPGYLLRMTPQYQNLKDTYKNLCPD